MVKKWILDILRGMVIGLANIIPGVSGGTMMVSMGIYDTLIYCINHLFKEFKKSVMTLLPYVIGMAAALLGLSYVITHCLQFYPLPTACAFIGLILGGVPAIVKEAKGEKKGAAGTVLFVLFFAAIVIMQIFKTENVAVINLNFFEMVKLMLLGMLASATMVIPGVSGSMMLMILGYYAPVIGAVKGLTGGAALGSSLGILIPFGIGVVLGIFAIAKLIEVLLKKWKGYTYCAILGLVASSPVVILMEAWETGFTLSFGTVAVSVVTLLAGYGIAYFMSRMDDKSVK